MDNKRLAAELLKSSNYDALSDSTTEFVKTYIKKLVWDVLTHVDPAITIGNIELVTTYSSELELSQEITGIPAAYSAIDGEISVLTSFSEQYAHLGISEYDLEKFYPEKVEGTMPTIEEIEAKLRDN